jgi:50S ribosomal protein L16 3-hydroxylase
MRVLADIRRLSREQVVRSSDDAREVLASWVEAGWAHALED